jgi:putative Holliday junction resolvase
MRFVGVDLGERRIGLAVSDASATLARPLRTIERDRSDERAARGLLEAIAALHAEDEVSGVVVGLPTHLDGTASDQTARVRKMVDLLASRLTIPIALQDERLSSHEAEERLALHERDWRKRKAKLDAASAAVILQDYLDAHK